MGVVETVDMGRGGAVPEGREARTAAHRSTSAQCTGCPRPSLQLRGEHRHPLSCTGSCRPPRAYPGPRSPPCPHSLGGSRTATASARATRPFRQPSARSDRRLGRSRTHPPSQAESPLVREPSQGDRVLEGWAMALAVARRASAASQADRANRAAGMEVVASTVTQVRGAASPADPALAVARPVLVGPMELAAHNQRQCRGRCRPECEPRYPLRPRRCPPALTGRAWRSRRRDTFVHRCGDHLRRPPLSQCIL